MDHRRPPPADDVGTQITLPQLLNTREDLLPTAFALDAVLIELVFVGGPLITAAAVATTGPQGALAASAVAILGGTATLVFALKRYGGRPESSRARRSAILGALRSPGVRTLTLASFPLGFYLGALQVSLPAFGTAIGEPALGGVLLALLSVAGVASGLLYGASTGDTPLATIHLRLALALPVAVLPLAFATSTTAVVLLTVLAGLPVTPLVATRNELVQVVAPVGAMTEAFAWPLTAMVAGISGGAAVGGILADAYDWTMPLLAGALIGAAAALVIWLQRQRLVASDISLP